ncbi:hypothetical protein [Pseudomonas phage vB_PseuGesM_254]|uniref:Uncharacterized protein n=1 Tax=Pseudomonas phage vB_PseuGesM_254 TaxID=3092638 RepID=A0AAX4G6N6_9CAUD|nr:hypothetical protein [Pseudomonas phage PseuGes_254]
MKTFVGQLMVGDCIELIDRRLNVPYLIEAIAWLQNDDGDYDCGQFHLKNGDGELVVTLYMMEQYNVIPSPWAP